jgi:hypothetical protein
MSNAVFYINADYAGYAVPTSEGGKGPENAREVLGIECEHHYGVTTHALPASAEASEVVYRLVRDLWHPFKPERHEFNVTDDNHTWIVEMAEKPHWHSRVALFKNEKAPRFLTIPGIRFPWWVEDGASARWFDQPFRVVTYGMIAAEVACDLDSERKYLDEAASQRDSIRGRKRASQCRSFAQAARWRAEGSIVSRWPQFYGRRIAA